MLQPYRILLQIYRILLLPLKIYHILKEFCSNLMEFYHILWRFYEFYDFTNFVAIFQNFIASFTFVFQSQQLYSTRVFSTSNWGLTSIYKCHVQKLKIARFFCTVPQGRGGEPEEESAGQSGQCSLLALEQWSIEISN